MHLNEISSFRRYAELDFESSPWDVLSPQAKEFVQRLLQRDPAARPTAEDALRHPWLAESGATGASAVPLADTIVQRLQRFGTYGKLKQAALRKVAHAALMARAKYITSTSTATTATNYISNGNESIPGAMKAVFASLDPTGSGRVSLATLRAELGGGHFRLSEEEVEQMCAQLHADAAGEVDWEAWVAAMSDWRTVRGSADWDTLVTEAFASLDVDEDASLGLADLEAALCGDDGCDVDDEAEAALREADSDGDGAVSLEEFRELLSAHDGGLELFDARLSFDMEGDGLSSSEGE
jgi:calcium-dependent protein kinase